MVVLPPDIVIFIKWQLFCADIFLTRDFWNDGTKSGIYSNTLKKIPWYQTSFTKVYSDDISYPKNVNIHSRINNINIHRNVNISSEIWLLQDMVVLLSDAV